MAIEHAPDDRTIYLALNNIFTGSMAAIRRPAPIKKVFQQHQKRTEVVQLLNKYDLPTVVERVQWLLAERVFESTEYAKAKFPDLFQVSAAQSADRAASEAAAAARQARTLEEAVQQEEEDGGTDSGIENVDYLDGDPQASKQQQQQKPQPQQPEGLGLSGNVGSSIKCTAAGVVVPSLFPMYLPFATGHRILAKTQSILEAACFRFAAETIPDVLARRGWDCAEAVELNVVVRQLLKHRSSLDRLEANATTSTTTTTTTTTTPAAAAPAAAAAAAGEQDLIQLTRSITQLRHTAVHRGRVTAKVLSQFVADAESLAAILGADDRGAMSWLSGTRRRVERQVAELEDSKSMLEAKLRRALGDIAARRAGLDRLEGAVVADVLREDGECVAFIGASLEEEGGGAILEGEEDGADLGGAQLGELEGPCGVAEGGCSAAGVGGGGGGDDDADVYSLPGGCDTEDDEDYFEDALEYDSSLSEWFPGC
ncbi:hypothetical protein VPNG_04497 [Cytospora leucostoma]|uniref:Uncharacterized protein n=1 Tax=Cytospora leucostoma TaxID=1230097 RepID=A0A423XC92_9PEZI|nr:hypothetical protein VPNG_04497 [Cytospora leucostoma]